MKIKDVMTRHVEGCRPDDSVRDAAHKMKSLDVGFIPVCEGDRVVGLLTDRDICLRIVAEGRDHGTMCREIMSSNVISCREDQDIKDAARMMEEHQIRRLPIVDEQRRLVGILSLGDLAVDIGDARRAGKTLEAVSEPARPRRVA